MKIGDRCFVRGYIDEIRKDTVIIRNTGGYFGTDPGEVITVNDTAHPEQRWIPCSEQLPDVAQRVLLSGHGQVMVGMLHSFGKYSLEPTGISYVYPKDDVDAWMPLPEPWKGEEE